jgi:hypothetical protein
MVRLGHASRATRSLTHTPHVRLRHDTNQLGFTSVPYVESCSIFSGSWTNTWTSLTTHGPQNTPPPPRDSSRVPCVEGCSIFRGLHVYINFTFKKTKLKKNFKKIKKYYCCLSCL